MPDVLILSYETITILRLISISSRWAIPSKDALRQKTLLAPSLKLLPAKESSSYIVTSENGLADYLDMTQKVDSLLLTSC